MLDYMEQLKKQAHDTPLEPGVYLWRDEENRIIYVGKAKVLRKRLRSYFSAGKDVKTAALVKHARSIETIIVANEYEALLLENTLIKQHSPKYNINLKDGKTYPVIRITAEQFPRVFKTRHIVEDESRYFGPFPNVQAVDTLLELIDKLFPLRKCRSLRTGKGRGKSKGKQKARKEPCMYYHIGRCLAPCSGRISPEEYQAHINRVEKLLKGETEPLIMDLSAMMHREAAALRFERALQFRDAIKAIEDLSTGNSVVDFDPEGRDYIAWAAEGVLASFSVFSMRGGKMVGRELFRTRSAASEEESLETFAGAYYSPDRPPPARIFLSLNNPIQEEQSGDLSPLLQWFDRQFGFVPQICPPDEHHGKILAMARQNAEEDLRRRLKDRGAGPALDELVQALGLHTRPERIEGFDIAQLDGKHPVASLISFKNGVPDRKNYRYFKLRTVVGLVDDFAAMREVVHRRYSRLLRENKELPDLVLIDGGIGQVNAARGVLDELGVSCDVVGLAKRDEELWLPHASEPVRLSKRSEALKVLQFVRDETHRFATTFNQKLRSKDLFFPVLEAVEGIGPKRAARIMEQYRDIAAIAASDPVDLAKRCGIGDAQARAVRSAAALALKDASLRREGLAKRRSGGVGTALAAEAAAEPEASYPEAFYGEGEG
jgi:excinuclease ABC subunit C